MSQKKRVKMAIQNGVFAEVTAKRCSQSRNVFACKSLGTFITKSLMNQVCSCSFGICYCNREFNRYPSIVKFSACAMVQETCVLTLFCKSLGWQGSTI